MSIIIIIYEYVLRNTNADKIINYEPFMCFNLNYLYTKPMDISNRDVRLNPIHSCWLIPEINKDTSLLLSPNLSSALNHVDGHLCVHSFQNSVEICYRSHSPKINKLVKNVVPILFLNFVFEIAETKFCHQLTLDLFQIILPFSKRADLKQF